MAKVATDFESCRVVLRRHLNEDFATPAQLATALQDSDRVDRLLALHATLKGRKENVSSAAPYIFLGVLTTFRLIMTRFVTGREQRVVADRVFFASLFIGFLILAWRYRGWTDGDLSCVRATLLKVRSLQTVPWLVRDLPPKVSQIRSQYDRCGAALDALNEILPTASHPVVLSAEDYEHLMRIVTTAQADTRPLPEALTTLVDTVTNKVRISEEGEK